MTLIELLAEDVARLRATYPEFDDRQLKALLVDAALRHRAHGPDPHDIADLFVHQGAAIAVCRGQLLTTRHLLSDAVGREAASYREGMNLDREVIPPLKKEAKRLRAQIRELEDRLRQQGLNPDAVEPAIVPGSIAVDDYEPPRFASLDERRAERVAFFRRIGGA